jgi:uncharacterized coiled-coil DUF342 family protein
MTDTLYKGYRIQKIYCIINIFGNAEDYCFSLKEAKKEIDKLKKELDERHKKIVRDD